MSTPTKSQPAQSTDHPSSSPSASKETETPQEKRIRSLTTRNATLEAQLESLSGQRTELLCQLYKALHSPSNLVTTTTLTSPSNPPTTLLPSTAAHTTPSSEPQQATLPDAEKILKHHIHLLHAYNEIRDIGMGLMGLIAEQRGVRIRDVQEEFGVQGKD